MTCTNEDKYTTNDGKCCDRCAAGFYVLAECDNTKATKCAECGRGLYTATKNNLSTCRLCRDCNSSNHHKKVKDCTAQTDAVCECEIGFYCSNDNCDHCHPAQTCPLGEGVKFQATRTNNTICAPCEEGTYSNVTDFHSPCRAHTRCDEIGRVLKAPGTRTTDAICGDFKFNCHWMLPTGLWSGLVLTALVLFGFMCWRKKRKSYREARSNVPAAFDDMVQAAPVSLLELPLPSTELNDHCQESCTIECCKLPLYNPDLDTVVSCSTQDSVDSRLPITPLKASVSFAESNHISSGYGNFLRTYSEPQEDEYCGA